jgi:hypothetical protein
MFLSDIQFAEIKKFLPEIFLRNQEASRYHVPISVVYQLVRHENAVQPGSLKTSLGNDSQQEGVALLKVPGV